VRRFTVLLIICCLILGLGSAAADAPTFEGLPVAQVIVNGEAVEPDVPAVILGGRTMVPLRFVTQALFPKASLDWRGAEATAEITTPAFITEESVEDVEQNMERIYCLLNAYATRPATDPIWAESEANLAFTNQILEDAVRVLLPAEWTQAFRAAVEGVSLVAAGLKATAERNEAYEVWQGSSAEDAREEYERLDGVFTWLQQAVAEHNAVFAEEFQLIVGREPDAESCWSEGN